MEIHERAATAAEIAALEQTLACMPTANARWRAGIGNALVFWATSLLAVYIVWAGVSWFSAKLAGSDFGTGAVSTRWVMGVAVPVCLACAVVSSVCWLRRWPDLRQRVQSDLHARRVVEEQLEFVAARRFQEPEHGGFVYFFRTADGRTFAAYDYASQELGVRGEDPAKSDFRPLDRLTIVRAPTSGHVLSRIFDGALLEHGPTVELAADPERWPGHDEYCDIPWGELDARLATAS